MTNYGIYLNSTANLSYKRGPPQPFLQGYAKGLS